MIYRATTSPGYPRVSRATLETIEGMLQASEKLARERFLTSGRHNDAEEWHKYRNAREELDRLVEYEISDCRRR